MKDLERYWTARARAFDRLYELPLPARLLNWVFRRAVYERWALTFEHAGNVTGLRVLDIGCGSGRYAVEFARRGASEVVGLDISDSMLALANEHAARSNVSDSCRFVRADFHGFNDPRPFDITVAIGFFDYVTDPSTSLRHMRELTAGRAMASFPAPEFPRAALRRVRYGRRGVKVRFYRADEVLRLARDAGFGRSRVLPLSGGTFLVSDV